MGLYNAKHENFSVRVRPGLPARLRNSEWRDLVFDSSLALACCVIWEKFLSSGEPYL